MDRNGKVPIFPNAFPYNELLLSGQLLAKTRNWDWDYRGQVLLYTSTRNATPVWQAYNMPPRNYAHKMIVGRGNLVDVRTLTIEEWWTISRQFNPTATDEDIERRRWGLVWPMYYGFFFEDLVRFPNPVTFKWPAGAILPIWRSRKSMRELLAPTLGLDLQLHPESTTSPTVARPKRVKEWIELNEEYVSNLKHLARRKIRLPGGFETSAYWDEYEACFVYNSGDDGAYMDDPDQRPTHVLD